MVENDYTKAPGRTLPLEELNEIYVNIIKKHGEKAYRSGWIRINNYSWFYNQITQKHNIKWVVFKKQFGDIYLLTNNDTLDEIIEKYKNIISEHGEKAYSCGWLRENGYNWIYQNVVRKYCIKWNKFKKRCGVNKILRMNDFSFKEIILKYKNIVNKHGKIAYNSEWIIKSDYFFIYTQVNKRHKVPWRQFIQMCKEEIEVEFEW